MRIVPGQTIAGVDLVQVRDALRRVKQRRFTVASLADRLGVDDDGRRLVDALAEQGYLEREQPHDGEDGWWRLTVQGNALTNATAAKPVKRATAQRALDGLLERAQQVNDDASFAYQVDEVVVFGSFLDPDAEVVGDVDVAIGLSPRYEGAELEQRSHERIQTALDAGRRFSSFFEELSWPQVEVLQLLKGRSRVLSITTIDDSILDVAEHRAVFLRDGAQSRRP